MPVTNTGATLATINVGSSTLTANVNFTATSSATATVVQTLGPVETLGISYLVEFYCPSLTKGTTNASLELWVDGVFNQGMITLALANVAAGSGVQWRGVVALSSGVHTLTVRGFVDAGTGTVGAGTGATGQPPIAILTLRAA